MGHTNLALSMRLAVYRRHQGDWAPSFVGGNNFVWQVLIGARFGLLDDAI